MTQPTYFVTDVETNGPTPGVHSMISFACIACRESVGIVDGFEVNLLPLPEMSEHPEVMAWWRTEPEAYAYVNEDQIDASDAMDQWVAWIEQFPVERVFVAHPLSFDGAWMDWYLRRFSGRPLFRGPLKGASLFSDAGLDLPSYAAGKLGISPELMDQHAYPDDWMGGVPHSHRAIDDATGYAHLLLRLLTT
ncbi:MAG: DNA polymerase III subunit epsilon [Pseudomonadota bacterium]